MPRNVPIMFAAAIALGASALAVSSAPPEFEQHFVDQTLRIDFYHTGDAESEMIALDRVIRYGVWAGSRTHLTDPPELGAYRASALDTDGGVLFRRTFDSLFREYAATTPATRGVARTFHESVLLPCPKTTFRFLLERRGREHRFVEVFSTTIDPHGTSVVQEPPAAGVEVAVRIRHGDPHGCVDLAVLGEGYTSTEKSRFLEDFHRFAKVITSHEPFTELRTKINLYGIFAPSEDPGCDEPTRAVWSRTPFDASFNAFGSPRYLLTENNRSVRDAAAHVPYDLVLIMVNHDRYGGGGIYNLYATFTAHNPWSEYVCVHELGHAFAGLADEYYTSSVAYSDFYPKGIEPIEPNITALLNPKALKWSDLVKTSTPIPTPWVKETFDSIEVRYQEQRRALNSKIAAARREGASAEEVEHLEVKAQELTQRHARRVDQLLDTVEHKNEVGAFLGAGYSSEGLYRPMVDCIMFSKGDKQFCDVCQQAIREMVRYFSEDRPSESGSTGESGRSAAQR